MTTAQESTNGHRVFQPPASVENTPEPNSANLPANQDNNNPFPASAYHVPPQRFAPRPNAYAYDDSFHRPPETGPLPPRCQFMFSDGRQCTMARSDIHLSLCFYHADREEQLFGDPSYRCETRKLDFPELFSASRDLSTAVGVNRALAQVFRLLAQRRISRQEAATFGRLAKLLLRTISLMAAESLATPADAADLPSGESLFAANVYQQDELRGVNKDHQELRPGNTVHHERGGQFASQSGSREIPPELSHHAVSSLKSQISDLRSLDGPPSSAASCAPVQASTPPIAASPESPAPRVAMSNSRKISTSAPSACNSPETNTYENVELQSLQNQHLHKHTAREVLSQPVP